MKPKKKSRTLWSGGIISALGGFFVYLQAAPAGMFPPWVPYTAGGLVTLLGGVVLALKIQDRHLEARTKRTAADMLANQARETSAAKAAAKIGAGLMLALFAGCAPHWELCEVDLSNHPQKPRPAASARVRCSRTVLCNHAEGATCDGKELAKKGAQ